MKNHNDEPTPSMRKVGHVYAIESACGTRVKIGRSIQPGARMMTIHTMAGGSLRRHSSPRLKDCYDAERTLHQRFADKRELGEWFAISFSDAVSAITEYASESVRTTEAFVLQARANDKERSEAVLSGFRKWLTNEPSEDEALTVLAVLDEYLEEQPWEDKESNAVRCAEVALAVGDTHLLMFNVMVLANLGAIDSIAHIFDLAGKKAHSPMLVTNEVAA